jgi:putative addiction module CopG family antidote
VDIDLPPDLARFIESQVAAGRHASPGDVVRAALRDWMEGEAWRAEVRQQIEEGAADIEAGRVVDGEGVIRRLQQRLRDQA